MTHRDFPDSGQFFYFWKGRVALYATLKALGVGPGDEVIIPGFTCVVVPNAVLYLGGKPVYADIEASTYNLSAATVEPHINQHTRLIIAQNTFGLSADLDPIMKLAKKHNLMVVEDCAHGLGGYYQGKPNGTVAHAAFFSSQWSKPISTGLGGVVRIEDNGVAKIIGEIVKTMPQPSLAHQTLLRIQLLTRPLADHPRLYYPLVNAYRIITQKLGIPVGSSSATELEEISMPSGYLKQMTGFQRKLWQRGLTRLTGKIRQRQRVAALYDEFCGTYGLEPPYRPGYAEHAMLRYPLRVPAKAEFLRRARRQRIPVGDWFVSPLHPVIGDLSRWGYRAGQCPTAEQACREVVNLLTDSALSPRQLATLFAS